MTLAEISVPAPLPNVTTDDRYSFHYTAVHRYWRNVQDMTWHRIQQAASNTRRRVGLIRSASFYKNGTINKVQNHMRSEKTHEQVVKVIWQKGRNATAHGWFNLQSYSPGGANAHPVYHMFPWAHPNPQPKRHLDRFSHFWATVCITVRHMLSDRSPVLSVTLVYCGQKVGSRCNLVWR